MLKTLACVLRARGYLTLACVVNSNGIVAFDKNRLESQQLYKRLKFLLRLRRAESGPHPERGPPSSVSPLTTYSSNT